ncbi:hypothetical protein [Teredinibacter purpureus]|uniref:hypothetical protein n=1 Tax=Teredinibacter purpureus TaxID=2731756 RepID=UPI0013C4B6D2|nr:hypothetical protein [Teredinibacter purpureus]
MENLGLSMPVMLSYKQINDVAKPEYAQDQVDEAFFSFFTDNDSETLKDLMFNNALNDFDIAPWEKMIEECYESFFNKRYLVVVPTLITVIEGYLSLKIGTFNTTNVRMITPTETKAQEAHLHRRDKTTWLSVPEIVDALYQKSDLTGNEPSKLNRHWILHGRSTPLEAKTDSAKLFILLGSRAIA